MSFISLTFAAFFAVLILLYYLLPKKWQWAVLLTGSMVFYLFSGPKYLIYLLVTAVTTYFAGWLCQKSRDELQAQLALWKKTLPKEQVKELSGKASKKAGRYVALALAVDLGILIVLKYSDFIIGNINSFLPQQAKLPLFSFILPLGLSFYTFSAIGYIVDVGRGKYPAERNFAKFLLYLSYFPQIIQGPIPRFDRLAPQFSAPHPFEYKNLKSGFQLVLWGIFKKLVIADAVAPVVAGMLGNPDAVSGGEIWLGMFAWGIQLYTDFSGGIDITRGISEMLGIGLDVNFKRPYFALNLSDYWNRWHISLGDWMKDYFFYPMALSPRFARISKFLKKKCGKFIAKTVPVGVLSLLLFTVIGVWHGANWGEVLFGVFNGVVVLISTLCEPLFIRIRKPLKMDRLFVWRIFRSVRTFLIITVARVLSLPDSISEAWRMLGKMFGGVFADASRFFSFSGKLLSSGKPIMLLPAALGCLMLFAVGVTEEKGYGVRKLINSKPAVLWVILAAVGTAVIFLFGAYGIGYDAAGFIYSNY